MVKGRFISNANRIFALLLVVFACWPYFSQNIGLAGVVLLAGGWCITAFLMSERHTVGYDGILMSCYAVVMLLSYLIFGRVYGKYELYYYLSMVMLFFLPYYMFRFYKSRRQLSFLGTLALIGILCMLVGSVTSSYYTYLKPSIMKTISQALDNEYTEYRKVGIGSFGFIYMTVLMLIAIVGQWKRKQKLPAWVNVLLIVAFVAGAKCVIDSTFTTALLLLIVGVLLMLLTVRKKPLVNVIVYLIVFMATILLSQSLGRFLADITVPSEDVTVRLREIGHLLLGESTGENTESRMVYFLKSVECFFHYPLLGYNFAVSPEYTMGNHCQWLDIFAIYGLIGGVPLLATLIVKLRKVAKSAKTLIGYPYYGIVLFIFVIYGFLDPFLNLYNLGFAMFLLVPAIGCISNVFSEGGKGL